MVKRHVDGERRDGRIVVGGVVDRDGRGRDVVGGTGSARTRGGYREGDLPLLGRDRAERGKGHRRIDKRSDRLDDWRAVSIGQDGVTVRAGEVGDAAGRAVGHGRRVERDPELGKTELVVRSHPARKDRCHADHVKWNRGIAVGGVVIEHQDVRRGKRASAQCRGINGPIKGHVEADRGAGIRVIVSDRPLGAVDDPRPGCENHWLVIDVQKWALDRPIDDAGLIEVAGPDRVKLAIVGGQPHLVAVSVGCIRLVIAR